MSDHWDATARVCGNCRHWPLGEYQRDWAGCEPLGISGYGTDGTVSDCRRHAPAAMGRDSPGKTAQWPKTEKRDSCGDFERRPQSHQRARLRPEKPLRRVYSNPLTWWA